MEQRSVLYVAGAAGPEPPPTLTERADLAVDRVGTAAAALASVERTPPDCVVTAYHLPDDTGLSLAASVHAAAPETGVVVYDDLDRAPVRADDATTVAEFVDANGPAAEKRLEQLVLVAIERRCHAPYPYPVDEAERLAALPGPEAAERAGAALDRLAELAALHFGTAYGAVNVVDERHVRAIGGHGDVPESIPRSSSACTYAILDDGPTVIPDLGTDPRFGGGTDDATEFAFYAGAPIRDDDGHSIGTVCVYDRLPGESTGDDERFLSVLASVASDWLWVDDRVPTVEGSE